MVREYSASTAVAMTVTLASITAGNGRKTAYIDNSTDRFEMARITGIIRTGASGATAGTLYNFYLFIGDGATVPMNTDDLATGDVALSATPQNADPVGNCVVTAATGDDLSFDFNVDIRHVDEWSIGFMNDSDQTIDTTESNSFINYVASKL